MNAFSKDKPLVLLVDDVPMNLHVLVAVLRNSYRLKTATDGQTAIDLAMLEDKPDLILLDVMMPGMSGMDVMRHLRSTPQTRDIPVIFVTADVSEQSQLTGLDLGADDYLGKPVVPIVLKARVRNVIERQRSSAQLRLAAHVFEHSGEAIMITDRNNCIIEVNKAFHRVTGYLPEEVLGKNPRILSAGHTSQASFQAMWAALKEDGVWQGEVWNRHKNGGVLPQLITVSVVHSPQGVVDYFIASLVDLSQQKAQEEQIRYLSQHDPLTGLPNRLHLKVSLEQAISNARREKSTLSIMFIDLDQFKLINDTLGHATGDTLLVEVGTRLRQVVRENDIVARLGGDEFIVVLPFPNGDPVEGAGIVAKKIVDSLSAPYLVNESELHTSPSIGVAAYPQHGEDSETLMKNADIAMYEAKGSGRGRFCVFQGK